MSDNKHIHQRFVGKGYYIALILSAAAIGISCYLYNRNLSKTPSSLSAVPTEQAVMATEKEGVPALATTPARIQEPTLPQPTRPEPRQPLKTAAPVQGETVAAYAMDSLSYNQTTQDWRVHNGMDIAAAPDTPVTAAADGEVYTVYEDDTMGHTVVIRHADGYTTKYASLDGNICVAPGDAVKLGDPIGYVGTSALLESALEPHVHFCVTRNDKLMDPAEFLGRD